VTLVYQANEARNVILKIMQTGATRADPFIQLFCSVYEDGLWAKPESFEVPDQKQNGGIDAYLTRPDGKTLAIEHTIIEPFQREMEDFVSFWNFFSTIESDESLLVPGFWIRLFVPVATLYKRPKDERDVIVATVHRWLKSNRLDLRKGHSTHMCVVAGIVDLTLKVEVISLKENTASVESRLHVRRQQIDNDLGEVIRKALEKKLPKLVNASADKRILLLERQHMNLLPESILTEIESLRTLFPQLADVHEIWIVDTMFCDKLSIRFELFENGEVRSFFDFFDGKLFDKSEEGIS
jgi:hypothetical protein